MPSHDTLSRLFRNLDPDQFHASFPRFMAQFAEHCRGAVAIEGKVLRRSFDRASGYSALPRVASVRELENALLPAQRGVIARAFKSGRPPALGCGKPAALAAGRDDERGSGQNPAGKRPAQSRGAQANGLERDAKRRIERLFAWKNQTHQMGRRLPHKASGTVLKCDCPV
jgi:hypothetical protein